MKKPDSYEEVKQMVDAYNTLKGIDTSEQPDRVSTREPKKEFPKTPSMLQNNDMYWFGLGKHDKPIFPLVKDPDGDIVIGNVRYSRKRQHGTDEW